MNSSVLTVETIKNMLEAGAIGPNMDDVVKAGKITGSDSVESDYSIYYGWDIAKCYACDKNWRPFNLRLMEFIEGQKYDEEKLAEVLATIQLEDGHWEWFKKAKVFLGDQYHWFFLMAREQPQAACVIYHPKESALGGSDVFYVEYLAVAPWNRANPMQPKLFSSLGSLMIKSVLEFATTKLMIGHGFSLHSLPRATGFYQKIGMQEHPDSDKGPLKYYEMPPVEAAAYMVMQ